MASLVEVAQFVSDAVNDLTSNGAVFSAYDVTKKVRNDQAGHVGNHNLLKSFVHAMFNDSEMPDGYTQELITLESGGECFDAFVYSPNGKSGFDHELAQKQTVSVSASDGSIPTPDFGDSTDEDETEDETEGIVRKVTNEHRVNIPQKVIDKVQAGVASKAYDIFYDNRLICKVPNKDGRVRITLSDVPTGTALKVAADSAKNQVLVSPAT
jgi:hypothetical protein